MEDSWIDFAARGAGLMLCALVLYLTLARASAGVRSALLVSALVGLIVLPAAGWLLPRWDAPVLPAPTVPETMRADGRPSLPADIVRAGPAGRVGQAGIAKDAAVLPEAPSPAPATAPVPVAPAALARANAVTSPAAPAPFHALALLWLAGIGAVLTPWIVGLLRAAAWTRQATPFDRRDVALPTGAAVAVHPAVGCPLTVGLWRPAILLPPRAREWPRSTLQAVLLHEAAHASRRDVLACAVARLASALHWFDPLVWFAAARMRRETERVCDEAAIRGGVAPTSLANALVQLAREARTHRLHGAAATWGPSRLAQRVDVILAQGARSRRRGPLRRLAAALTFALAFVGVATLQPTTASHAGDDRPAADATLTVGPQGCDHTTIQAAVDAAPAGARIRIAAGSYAEHVTVGKALTLEGAGWTKTRLRAAWAAPQERGRRPAPTLRVHDTRGVVLRGLRIALDGEPRDGVMLRGAAMDIEAAEVRMQDCAVVPSPASGIDISGDASVRLDRCLVAAVGATGISIGARGAGMPKVRVIDCDVRFGHHRGISIGASCNDVIIAGCRISGAAWHGIRYDNASPTIRRNRITNNVRSAIYASGRTRATVEGNLFADTGMGAVSCWYHCGDVIAGNTFSHNARAHLSILGASSPTVEHNVFAGSPKGISWGGIASRRGDVPAQGRGTIRENVFWQNGKDTTNPVPASNGNRAMDPMLDADHTLAADSPARKQAFGATALPPAESRFPAQPEEAAARRLFEQHMARYGEWEPRRGAKAQPRPGGPLDRAAKARREAEVRERDRSWTAALRPQGDARAREKALAEIFDAIDGDDEALRMAALRRARWLGSIPYDRAAFRARILPFARSKDLKLRYAARSALVRVLPDPADLPWWLEEVRLADNSRTAEDSAENLVLLADGVVRGQVADAVLHVLRDGTKIKKAFVMRGIAQAQEWDPRVEARLIAIVRSVPVSDYDSAYYFHFIARRMAPKSDAVVDLILDTIDKQKTRGGMQTLLSGLQTGLSEDQQRRSADRLMDAAESTGNEFALRDLLGALAGLAAKRHVARLEALARKPLEERTQRLLTEALAQARKRP